MNGQCARVLEVLADEQPHSVTEIHRRAGTMRLNSRVSELRQKHGLNIVCSRTGGSGPDSYAYTLVSSTEAGPSKRPVSEDLTPTAEVSSATAPERSEGASSGAGPLDDELQLELDWIDQELAHGIELDSPNARGRRDALRRQQQILQGMGA